MAPAKPLWDRSGRLLVLVLAIVLGSDLVTLAVSEHWSREIDSLSDRIVHNTTPSIEALAALRAGVVHAELELARTLTDEKPGDAVAREAVSSLERDIDHYLALPNAPGEPRYWTDVQRSWSRFDESTRDALEVSATGNTDAAWAVYESRVLPAGDQMVATALGAIDFHAESGRAAAARIKFLRHRAIVSANALAIVFTVLGIAGIILVRRQQRVHAALAEERTRFLEARSEELEQFAGRVAHDIRNPLGAASMTAHLLARRGDDVSREHANRILRSLSRADEIISALLDFARAGARPDPGARTNVRETVLDFAASVEQEAARAGVEMHIDEIPEVEVACSPGVYLSLVGNLLRNALKYIGEGPERRITLRVSASGGLVRTEVIDTGPGIAPEVLPSLFEPFTRGPRTSQPGLGLGLATVKKLADGHDGEAGARSRVGEGSTFWFTLPGRATQDTRGAESEQPLHH